MPGGGGNSTTTGPWDIAQPYLRNALSRAGGMLNNRVGFNAPGFQTYVNQDPSTRQALAGMQRLAGQGNPLAGASQQAALGILGGQDYRDLLAKSGNEAWAGAVDTQANKLSDDITRQIGGGASFGSAAHTGTIVDQVGDFRQKAISDEFQKNIANQAGILGNMQGSQLAAAGQAGDIYNQQYLPFQQLARVGAANEDFATRQLQSRLDNFNTRQAAPWNRLNSAFNIFSGAGNSGNVTTPPNNIFGNTLGGGILGYQSGLQGGGSGFGGALLGGGLGILGSLFSDERVKQDIKRVGETDEGTPIYTYRYKPGIISDEPGPVMMGMMAQEVRKKHPEAVTKLPGGILAVDYGMAA